MFQSQGALIPKRGEKNTTGGRVVWGPTIPSAVPMKEKHLEEKIGWRKETVVMSKRPTRARSNYNF